MANPIEIDIEIPKNPNLNVLAEIPPKNEIDVNTRERFFTTHNELVGRSESDAHPINAITGLRQELDSKQGEINDLETIRSNAAAGKQASETISHYGDVVTHNKNEFATAAQGAKADTAVQPNSLAPVATSGKYGDLTQKPNYGASLSFTINQTTFVITAQLKDQNGNNLGPAQTVDLPLESVVVGGSYDAENKKIILTLENGSTIEVPVGDLVAGLQTEITVDNKLSADLVDDTSTTNKFVTTQEKTTWSGKQDAISDLDAIRSGASAGATALQPSALNGYATETWVGQQGFLTSTALVGYATEQWVMNQGYLTGIDSSDVISALGYTPYDASNPDGFITGTVLNSYVTKATTQTITGQKTFQRTESQFQDSVARFVSTYNSSSAGWRGRVIIGAKDYTFLIGTYNSMAALCGHKFTNSATEEGAAWSDIYFSPDGDKAIYFGGNSWRQNSGWFKVQNNASNTGGTVQVNIGSASSTNWKDVAYKGENVSDFNFTSISGYNSSSNQMLTHDTNGNLKWVNI